MAVAVYEKILDATHERVTDLVLDGIDSDNVVSKALPVVEEGDELPRVLLCPGRPETLEHRSSEDGWVYYDVLVVIVAAANGDFATWRPALLRWREQIRVALNRNKWPDAPTVFGVDIDHDPPIDPDLLGRNYVYSALSFRYRATEARS